MLCNICICLFYENKPLFHEAFGAAIMNTRTKKNRLRLFFFG